MKFFNLIYILLFFLSFSIASCVTSDYNFDNETRLGLSLSHDGFVVPGINDFDVPMSQIVELKDSGELIVDELTGNYLFYKAKDDMDTTTVNMACGSLCNATDDIFEYSLLDERYVSFTQNKRFPAFSAMEFESVLTPAYHPDVLKNSIRELFYMKVSLDIDVTMVFEGIQGFGYIDEIRYEVPFFYDVLDESQLVEKNVKAEGVHEHKIHVVGVDFTRKSPGPGQMVGIDPKTHQLILRGDVKVKGSVKMVNMEDFGKSLSPTINYRLCVGTMGTFAVTGRFEEKELVDIDPIDFEHLPDFVKDEEVVIDVENPVIRLTLTNEVPAAVMLNANMMSMRNHEMIANLVIGADHGTQAIAFAGPEKDGDAAVTSTIWISRLPIDDLPDSVSENIVVPDVMDLVRRMPDEVWVEAYARTDSTQVVTMSLSKDYKAVPKYEMVVPLKMGKDMQIVYNKDFDDLNKTLKHLNLTEMLITAKVENRIPLNLKMKMVATDLEGNEVTGLQFDLPEIPADANKDIAIRVANASAVNNLQSVDQLRLKLYARSSEELAGAYLNRNQNLHLSDVRIVLKTVDE